MNFIDLFESVWVNFFVSSSLRFFNRSRLPFSHRYKTFAFAGHNKEQPFHFVIGILLIMHVHCVPDCTLSSSTKCKLYPVCCMRSKCYCFECAALHVPWRPCAICSMFQLHTSGQNEKLCTLKTPI